MDKRPVVSWGRTLGTIVKRRELLIDGEVVGTYSYYEEDASQGSLDEVLFALAQRGVIEYRGLE